MYDYHLHTNFSFDAETSPAEMAAAAHRAGLQEICFTDHVDFDGSGDSPADLTALRAAILALCEPISVRFGAEVSLGDADCTCQAQNHLAGQPLDYIIGSVHMLDGSDPYYEKTLYTRETKPALYRRYLAYAYHCICENSDFSAFGHYDYIAKFATYPDRSISYADAPDEFDSIFDFLISHSKALELNTASWRNDPAWGQDILRRYRERGGELLTVGSDAHAPSRIGARIPEALDLARAAGFRYIATYSQREPILHRL